MTNSNDKPSSNENHGGLSILAEGLGVSIRFAGEEKHLLKDVDFLIEPGEFICILGPSGAGKTTLVSAMLGQRNATHGKIRIAGRDPVTEFRRLRGLVGYVPQQDICPGALPCRRAFNYAALIRLPADTTSNQLHQAIDQAMDDVGISHLQYTPIDNLSGGEKKRCSLATEVLSSPGLLLVDEATSSLDPASEARIMDLLAKRARSGMTVVCVTHHLDNVDRADKLIILAKGRVVWIGTQTEALQHFGVSRLSDVYLLLEDQPIEQWAEKWVTYRASLKAGKVEGQLEQPKGMTTLRLHSVANEHPIGQVKQFSTLVSRGFESLLRDRVNLAVTIFLPILLALAVFVGFRDTNYSAPFMMTRNLENSEKDVIADLWGDIRKAIAPTDASTLEDKTAIMFRVFLDNHPALMEHLKADHTERIIKDAIAEKIPLAPDREIISPAGTHKLLFVINISIAILGVLTGVKEIVKERPMWLLERRHGLAVLAYSLSKLTIVGVVLFVQVGLFSGVMEMADALRVTLGGQGPAELYRRGPLIEFGFNWLSAVGCALLGMIVSALIQTIEQGFLAVPLLIVPHLLLGARILPIRGGLLDVLAKTFSPVYWAHRGVSSEGDGVPYVWQCYGPYNDAMWIPLVGILLQIAVAFLVLTLVIKYRSKGIQS